MKKTPSTRPASGRSLQERSQRRQRIIFAVLAGVIIISWVLSLVITA